MCMIGSIDIGALMIDVGWLMAKMPRILETHCLLYTNLKNMPINVIFDVSCSN